MNIYVETNPGLHVLFDKFFQHEKMQAKEKTSFERRQSGREITR